MCGSLNGVAKAAPHSTADLDGERSAWSLSRESRVKKQGSVWRRRRSRKASLDAPPSSLGTSTTTAGTRASPIVHGAACSIQRQRHSTSPFPDDLAHTLPTPCPQLAHWARYESVSLAHWASSARSRVLPPQRRVAVDMPRSTACHAKYPKANSADTIGSAGERVCDHGAKRTVELALGCLARQAVERARRPKRRARPY